MSKVEFIKLIGTWPGGSMFVLGEYKVTFEKEVVRLHLKIDKEALEYKEMGEPSQDEKNPPYNLRRSKEGQEEFFRGKGKEIIVEMLIRVKGIEGIKRLGCGQMPNSYVSRWKFRTIIIKDIKKRN